MKKFIIFIFFITIACSNNKVVNNHGLLALEKKANKIEISKTNKNEILTTIGNPSTKSLFDDNTWYYLQTEMINQSFFKLGKSKIKKNNVLEISFDKYGIVKTKKLFELENMNDLDLAKSNSAKTYQNKSYYQKLLNSLKQKIDSPKLNRKRN
tara:strand:+ start:5596 stop:6054 length:459 start_codon:yes stop_codon:yes gene_type:complete